MDLFVEKFRNADQSFYSFTLARAITSREHKTHIYLSLLRILNRPVFLQEFPRRIAFLLSDLRLISPKDIVYFFASRTKWHYVLPELDTVYPEVTEPALQFLINNTPGFISSMDSTQIPHLQDNDWLLFRKQRKSQSQLSTVLLNDNLISLQQILAQPNFNPLAIVPDLEPDIPISASAKNGSVRCFHYLLLNLPSESIPTQLLDYAVLGRNREIIQLVLEMNYTPSMSTLQAALRSFDLELIKWIFLLLDPDNITPDLLLSGNFSGILYIQQEKPTAFAPYELITRQFYTFIVQISTFSNFPMVQFYFDQEMTLEITQVCCQIISERLRYPLRLNEKLFDYFIDHFGSDILKSYHLADASLVTMKKLIEIGKTLPNHYASIKWIAEKVSAPEIIQYLFDNGVFRTENDQVLTEWNFMMNVNDVFHHAHPFCIPFLLSHGFKVSKKDFDLCQSDPLKMLIFQKYGINP